MKLKICCKHGEKDKKCICVPFYDDNYHNNELQ